MAGGHGSIPPGSLAAEIEERRVFDLQHAASRRDPAPDLAGRLRALAQLRALIIDNQGALAGAIFADFGVRARAETELLEIVLTLNAVRYVEAPGPALHVAGEMEDDLACGFAQVRHGGE